MDKETLHRDIKLYRKQLRELQKELEEYKNKFEEYAERLRRNNTDEEAQYELNRLEQSIEEKNVQIKELQDNIESRTAVDEQTQAFKDKIADLEHELRQKDQELDEKDDQLDELQQTQASSDEIEELKRQLYERDEDIKGLHDALRTSSMEADQKLRQKDRALELKDDELHDLEKQVEAANRDESFAAKRHDLDNSQAEIDRLQKRLQDQQTRAEEELRRLKEQLEQAEGRAATESRQRVEDVDEKEHEIRALEQKLASTQGRDEDVEKLHDKIADLEADVRARDRDVEQGEEQVENLKSKIQQIENETDEELIAAQDRIQELEIEQQRHVKDLQILRDAENKGAEGRSQALVAAEERAQELQQSLEYSQEHSKQLQKELHRLKDDVAHLERELDEKEQISERSAADWARQRKSLEAEQERLEEKVRNLEGIVSQLRESQGTLSGKEMALQRLIDTEKEQHESASTRLRKELEAAKAESDELQNQLEQAMSRAGDWDATKSRHAQVERELKDKIQSLEDEIEVLQSSLDQDATRNRDDLSAARSETDSLRRDLQGLKKDLAAAEQAHTSTKAKLNALEQAPVRSSPSPKGTPPAQRAMRERVQELESSNALIETQMARVDAERKALQERIAATRIAEPEQQQQHHSIDSSSELKSLRDNMTNLKQQNEQLEDELDLLTADVDAANTARDEAITTIRDLRKQLQDAVRAADRKYQSQVTAYERDIANLESELEASKTSQHEAEIKSDSATANVARLRKRLEGAEQELAAARARQRTDSTSPEANRRELRELQDQLRDAQAKSEEAQARLERREQRSRALEAREDGLRTELRSAREDRRAALDQAEALAGELDVLRDAQERNADELAALRRTARKPDVDGVAMQKERNRHAAELRGLAKQITYLTARCTRAEKLRQDAGFAKQYVAKVVEVYAKVHKLDLRMCREMGVVVDMAAVENGTWLEGEPERKLGGGVDATPRKGGGVKAKEILRRREKRPTLSQVAVAIRAAIRMKKRTETWREVEKSHEGVLKKWRAQKAERKMVKA